MPILPFLQRVIDSTPTGALSFFITGSGKPFTAGGAGNWFAKACKAAGVPGRAHGLRKIGATLAAEDGATVLQLMAMYGWKTEKQAIVYVRAANRKKLAADGSAKLAGAAKE